MRLGSSKEVLEVSAKGGSIAQDASNDAIRANYDEAADCGSIRVVSMAVIVLKNVVREVGAMGSRASPSYDNDRANEVFWVVHEFS